MRFNAFAPVHVSNFRKPVSARWAAGLLSACLLLAGAAAAQPGQGQNPAGQNPAGQSKNKIRVEGDYVIFAVDERKGIPLLEFVKFAQKFTGKRFYIDRSQDPSLDPNAPEPDTAKNINLLGTLRIRKDEFYAFFQTVLFIKDWVCVPRGEGDAEFIDLMLQTGSRGQTIKKGVVWVPPDRLADYRKQTGTFIVTTVKLKYVNAQLASANLRTFFNDPRGLEQLIAIGGQDQRSLMITGFGPTVYNIVQLLQVVDIKDEKPHAIMRVIPLENGAVEDIEPIVTELLSEKTRVAAAPAGGGVVAPEDQIPVKIMTLANQNALVVYAHEETVRMIENMIAQLDTRATKIDSNFVVYKLINTLAKDMKDVLSDFVQQATQAQQATQTGGSAPGAGTTRREIRPVIRDDEKSNSLLISASRSQREKIIELIRQLDTRQDQVLIETALVDLGTQDVERLGFELGLLDLSSGFGMTSFGLSSFQDTDGNGLADTRLPDLQNPLAGLTGGIIRGNNFAIPVIMNALKSDNRSNVLSIPSVLVNNNEDATVTSKDSIPTTRSTQGNVTTDTSFSGFQDAGIDLRISPSISEGGYVKINLRLEVSKFQGAFDSASAVPPPKTIRTIETAVTIPTGHTMVFGGVIEDQTSETEDGIPFLKEIPLLGALFRNRSTTKRKSNLYFFLTPHILSDPDFADLAQLTFRKKMEAARYIGHKRIKVVDPTWRGQDQPRLEDTPATVEDLDRLGGFDIPVYVRPPSGTSDKNDKSGSAAPDKTPGTKQPPKGGTAGTGLPRTPGGPPPMPRGH